MSESSKSLRYWLCGLTCSLLYAGLPPVFALEAAVDSKPVVSARAGSSQLVDTIRNARIVNPDYPLHAIVTGSQAKILTRRHPKATDDDLKIDSVLITKACTDAFVGQFSQVKVIFRDEDSSNGKSVLVTAQDIQNYASGEMEPQKFLSTLKISTIDGELDSEPSKTVLGDSGLQASPGPYEEQRLILLDRINSLRRRGTGVAPYETLFLSLDELAKKGDPGPVRVAVLRLADKLTEQEKMIKQAHLVGAGQGIRTNTNSSGKSSAGTGNGKSPAGANVSEAVKSDSEKARTAVGQLFCDTIYGRLQKELYLRRQQGKDVASYEQRLELIKPYKERGEWAKTAEALLGLGKDIGMGDLSKTDLNSSPAPEIRENNRPGHVDGPWARAMKGEFLKHK
jgi:hypothetical protein